MNPPTPTQVVLLILDGWGYREDPAGNAIAIANPQYMNSLWATYPHTLIPASGESVGLPQGNIGTSEIGHSIIGSGTVLPTDMIRINNSIKNNSLKDNEALSQLFDHVIKHNSTLHLLGLVSPGGVHSHQEHLFALIRLAATAGIRHIAIQAITDGRDTPPQSASQYLVQLEQVLDEIKLGSIVSISGRYFAMDRDTNWDRIEKAIDVLFHEGEEKTGKASAIVDELYRQEKSDEFLTPFCIPDQDGKKHHLTENDGVLFFNFRPDRARELSMKIAMEAPNHNLCFATMTQYDPKIQSLVLFHPLKIEATLSDELSKAGLTQLHVAETEKYAHVTYFFNGGSETPHSGEQFAMIDSRKDIPTFDLAPEMKAKEIADKVIEGIDTGTNFVVANLANADMVGHTGNLDATVTAITILDEQIKRIVEEARVKGATVVITADHGNAEEKVDLKTHQPITAHSLNPVPCIITKEGVTLKENPSLADIAPTILTLFNLPKPEAMTGKSLI
jgi:2,3-bisphosphoglycerate-independent phosphoglycerate mutase